MRTVIIAAKEHLNWIFKYRKFFAPFISGEDIKFCEWNKAGDTIETIIPEIYDRIGGRRNWRAYILFDDEVSRNRENPFDLVEARGFGDNDENIEEENYRIIYERYKANLKKKETAKMAEYDEASSLPLVKLCTFLCPLPLDSVQDESDVLDDFDINMISPSELLSEITERRRLDDIKSYKTTAGYKKDLRERLVGNEKFKAVLPQDVYCISIRTILDERKSVSEKLSLAWNQSTDVRYSDFCDRNMYFDRMRFFTYDILPKDHVNYKFNYMEFIYTLLVFAKNPVPSDSIAPGRLYVIESSCSEDRLKRTVELYDQKLENTIVRIERTQAEIEKDIPGPMSDTEAETLFHTNKVITVNLPQDFDMEGYYADKRVFGLSTDCPSNEHQMWQRMYKKSNSVMKRLLKQPLRSLEKSTEELRRNNKEESAKVLGLNHFQIDDIREYAENEEKHLVSIETRDFYNTDEYLNNAQTSSEDVKSVIDTRMTKKTTVILGLVCLFVFFIGFIPVLFFNKNVISVPLPLVITMTALGLLFLTVFIFLFVLRKKLRDKVDNYNSLMKDVKHDVDDSMNRFSDVLSSVCHIMRANYVLEATRKKDNVFKQRIRVLRGHIEDIRDNQIELRELFGEYINGHPGSDGGVFYQYNFERSKKYEYPVPFDENGDTTIPYIEEGVRVAVPFDFINSIELRMEDLYE